MSLAQRYVFRRLLGAFLVAFPALSVSIWASQALQQLSLVTDRGQGLGVFFEATLLLLPGLITIIAPVTILIVVIYALNSLNADSELASLSAGGASPALFIRPILALAIPVALLVAVCTLVFGPASTRASNALVAEVNSSVIGSLMRPGQFRALEDNVTAYIGDRSADGTLTDLFVYDQRDADETVTYLAAAGALTDSPDGTYLLMQDGQVQRQDRATGAINVIEFDNYAFNLSSLQVQTGPTGIDPSERETAYLLDPDPADPVYVANPYRYQGELHNRISTPLYTLALALIPALFLGRPRTARRGRVALVTLTAALAGAVMALGLFLDGPLETTPAMMPLGYGLPLLATFIPIAFMLSGRQVRAPRWLRALGAPLDLLARRRPPARRAA